MSLAATTARPRRRNIMLLSLALVLILCAGFAPLALAQQAVRSGAWHLASTWAGGVVPGRFVPVTIPSGLTVTIPAGTAVVSIAGNGGQIIVAGTLAVAGKLEVGQLMVDPGGAVTVEPTGWLTLSTVAHNEGTITNRGMFLSSATLVNNYGPFLNDGGATLDSRGEFRNNSISPFTNRGTVINRSIFSLYSPMENYGSFTTTTYGSVNVARTLNNHAGASFTNNGSFETDGCCKLTNDGAIVHQGSYFHNRSVLANTCTGTLTGKPISGQAAVLECATGVAATPSPVAYALPANWTQVASPAALNSLSAGSAAVLAATTVRGTDGNYYLLDGASGGLVHLQPKVSLMQTSRASDGSWWGVTAGQGIVRLQDGYWLTVPGQLRQVSVGSAQQVWGVNANNVLYRWMGGGWAAPTSIPIKQVSVAADGTVWAISASNAILRWSGDRFETMPGEATQVAVGSASNIWVVNAGGTVYRWNGSGWETATAAGNCKAVAAGADGAVFVVRSADGSVYRGL